MLELYRGYIEKKMETTIIMGLGMDLPDLPLASKGQAVGQGLRQPPKPADASPGPRIFRATHYNSTFHVLFHYPSVIIPIPIVLDLGLGTCGFDVTHSHRQRRSVAKTSASTVPYMRSPKLSILQPRSPPVRS